jgi:adenylate cyclase
MRQIASTQRQPAEEAVHYHPNWSHSPVATWLVEHAGSSHDRRAFLAELSERLVGQGVPLFRVSMGLQSMHPEVAARNVRWARGQIEVDEIDRSYDVRRGSAYETSPVRPIHEGAGAIRRRLEGTAPLLDFPLLQELKAAGATDYVIMPLARSVGLPDYISWTTDRPDGFTTAQLTLLYDLLPLIALRVELATSYDATATLLDTYLGRAAAERVLEGRVRRGEVEALRAAVLYSDLRGFTGLADRLPAVQVIDLLDDYMELVGRPIYDHGGEILKFIGDGMLAIFSATDSAVDACRRALNAARDAQLALKRTANGREAAGEPPLAIGIGLHFGDVQFGNIGARDRLDFTVIGRVVNEVARVEELCKELSHPGLATAAFVAHLPREAPKLASLGHHHLRGVSRPQEIFRLPQV